MEFSPAHEGLRSGGGDVNAKRNHASIFTLAHQFTSGVRLLRTELAIC